MNPKDGSKFVLTGTVDSKEISIVKEEAKNKDNKKGSPNKELVALGTQNDTIV